MTEVFDLRKFAKLNEVRVIRCSKKEWGGEYGFKVGNCSVCGFQTRPEAYRAWFDDATNGMGGTLLKYLLPNEARVNRPKTPGSAGG